MKFPVDSNGNTKCNAIRKGKDLIIEVPSFPLISKNKKDHGKRNIQ